MFIEFPALFPCDDVYELQWSFKCKTFMIIVLNWIPFYVFREDFQTIFGLIEQEWSLSGERSGWEWCRLKANSSVRLQSKSSEFMLKHFAISGNLWLDKKFAKLFFIFKLQETFLRTVKRIPLAFQEISPQRSFPARHSSCLRNLCHNERTSKPTFRYANSSVVK